MNQGKEPPWRRAWLKKMWPILLVISVLILLFPVIYLAWLHYNSQQLWQIVNQRCVPMQQQFGSPKPCLLVNMVQRYTVFNDANGPLHTLLLPNDKITGIESPVLLHSETENYFYHAWNTRYLLQQKAAFPIPDRYLALAVNSRYGRTQNQLHIHLACLKPDVYHLISQLEINIGYQWQALQIPLVGHRYLAIKVAATTDPFIALSKYVQDKGDDMKNYGLVRLATENNEAILLATRIELTAFTLGTAEELLDVDCKLARELAG